MVFPSIVSSKAEMVCNGVISVETAIIEFIDSINFILSNVPNRLLAKLYKLPLDILFKQNHKFEEKNELPKVDKVSE